MGFEIQKITLALTLFWHIGFYDHLALFRYFFLSLDLG